MRSLYPLACLAACTFNRVDPAVVEKDAAPTIDADEREWVVIETLTVPAMGMPRTSTKMLQAGVTYRLRASGTFYYDTQVLADAEFFDIESTTPDDVVSNVDVGLAVNDDTPGPTRTFKWGAYKASHLYEAEWIGDGSTITAKIHDGNYSGNFGSLSLEILALQ